MNNIATINPQHPDIQQLINAGKLLAQGELVAFPTETVYGLGANALDSRAVAKIFEAKGRPADNPLIVHLATADEITNVANDIPNLAYQLIEKFWPGPLTLVLPKNDSIPDIVTANSNTVAVRQPAHPVALGLIAAAGVPVAAPSANKSGKPSPTTAQHVAQDLGSKVSLILDGGPTQVGLESTVLDLTSKQPTLLRAGAISKEELEEICGPILTTHSTQTEIQTKTAVKSPGMKYRHYAPQAKVHLLTTINASTVLSFSGKRAVLQLTNDPEIKAVSDLYFSFENLENMAQQLFAVFRQCDQQDVDHILVEMVPNSGLGRAILDRVKRAGE